MPNPLERAAAKGMGKVKAIGASLEGLHGVFRKLAEQHGEVSMLLARLRTEEDAEDREDLWDKIRSELVSHERGELQEVYPVLRQHAETKAIADEHDMEAGELEATIDEIDNLDFTSNDWDVKVEELISLVKHHVDEEENKYFPTAQQVIGKDESKRIEERFLSAKKSFMTELE